MQIFLFLLMVLFCAKNTYAAENSVYEFHWLDPDKAVYVLQNKTHKIENKFFVDLGYVKSLSSEFQETNGVMLTTGYNWHEEWGIEALYVSYNNRDNEAFRNVSFVSDVEPFVRRHTRTIGIGPVWSPFYGKINTLNEIIYFTWNFSVGYALVTTENNLSTITIVNKKSVYKSEDANGAYLKSLIKFNVSEHFNVGVGYFATMYNAAGPKAPKSKKLRYDSDLLLNLGWIF
jgi:outer membrane beta-barrel protein